jgi:hypothetical protein
MYALPKKKKKEYFVVVGGKELIVETERVVFTLCVFLYGGTIPYSVLLLQNRLLL